MGGEKRSLRWPVHEDLLIGPVRGQLTHNSPALGKGHSPVSDANVLPLQRHFGDRLDDVEELHEVCRTDILQESELGVDEGGTLVGISGLNQVVEGIAAGLLIIGTLCDVEVHVVETH